MLDKIAIFTKGGMVLWSMTFATMHGVNPIDDLIRTVLLEERGGSDKTFTSGTYTVEWTLHNDLELIFVVVYQKILQLLYIEELLQLVKDKFVGLFGEALKGSKTPALPSNEPYPFSKYFNKLHEDCELKSREKKVTPQVQRSFSETKKGKQKMDRGDDENKKKKKKGKGKEDPPETKEEEVTPPPKEEEPQDLSGGDEIARNIAKLRQSGGIDDTKFSDTHYPTGPRRFVKKGPSNPKIGSPSTKGKPSEPVKKEKKARRWEEGEEDFEAMQRKLKESGKLASQEEGEVFQSYEKGGKVNLDDWDDLIKNDDEESESDEEEEVQTQKSSGWSIGSIFSGLTNRTLSRADLEPVLAKFRENLIERNVASEIADELCESVCRNLEGKTMSSFKRIRTEVKSTMEEALTRILTPKRQIQLLREITKVNKEEKRPYTIVMVGVNGVGKSTNLAKVCYYLLQQDLKVMICACDTFRSGAVEQLKTHSRNLNVPLFERGYEKDPAGVAFNGIHDATQKGMDVVLIDTAGRMQDNRPLMQALAKLVYTNEPDLILFVGEALVGNEAVDQLKKFNRALEEYAPATATSRLIDGIILTKFDTIDKKVGAAISMVYTTGQPIVFVGTGQHYNDLKAMNTKTIVQALVV